MVEFVPIEAHDQAKEMAQSTLVESVHREGNEPTTEEPTIEEHVAEDSTAKVSVAHGCSIWWPFAHRIGEVPDADWEKLRRLMIGLLTVGPRNKRDLIKEDQFVAT
ncbi:uncharacterized protein A4U43_C01F15650 [Asparagus officinalis]|uniref:Uncharacterized protein n=1 Tax=Asparagus officinalis TaxID=4686 RepID=A0A5P1FS45_ASPOF|nr:uncharacterized protein A4U43_C01F15650 [Asparagus officinalis]